MMQLDMALARSTLMEQVVFPPLRQVLLDKKELGARIKAARKRRGYTQTQLSDRMNWGERGQVRLSHYEIGRRQPGLPQLRDIAAGLGLELQELIGEEAGQPIAAEPASADERKRLMRAYDVLSEPRRHAAMKYIEALSDGENEERAKMLADLQHIARLSTPRTAEMVEALARAVAEGGLSENDAQTIQRLIVSLSR